VTKWEQKYLEESTMRQIEVNAASVPKDAKIAALEKTSQESEKMIMAARNEKLKHMDELHAANRRCAELEGQIRDLESKLAEKDAMIKVLNQHSRDKDSYVLQTLSRAPNRHARSMSTMGLTSSSSSTSHFSHRGGPNLRNSLSSSSGVSTTATGSIITTTTSETTTTSTSQSVTNTTAATNEEPRENSNTKSDLDTLAAPEASQDSNDESNLQEQQQDIEPRIANKDSIIKALRDERERYPDRYWKL